MKRATSIILLSAIMFTCMSAAAQNVLMNIVTQKSGIAAKGQNIILEITVCNTDASDPVPVYKLRPQISIPSEIAIIADSGHNLPEGWTITSNNGTTIRLSNGTDIIPSHGCRTILIAITGKRTGGPSTVSGNLLFSNGEAPGSVPGSPTKNDNPADNSSTTTCTIIK